MCSKQTQMQVHRYTEVHIWLSLEVCVRLGYNKKVDKYKIFTFMQA